ncbi:hypothetical protein [Jhaorihella thermophila]|uniref:hypothetical protein n=1 Tax=Jhaorihella thermophila TaxID=488547 RepID=UPI00360F6B21
MTFDKTNNTYVNLGMKVRDLPEGHDRSDRLAAMARAMEEDHPALGVYFEEQRQTLGEVMQDAIDKAQGMNLAPKGV